MSIQSPRQHAVAGTGFVLVGAASIQWSATLVNPLFQVIGPAAASAWRFLFGALVLLFFSRPRVRGWSRHQWRATIVLGVATALMNLCFYQAIARIPLGGAVAIEYLGPFLVAAFGKRSWRHFAFVVLAGLGVLALTRPGGGFTSVGVLFAAGSGLFWAVYAFASHRVGGLTTGFQGLAVSMSIAALVTLPFSLSSAATLVERPGLLVRMIVVATMATVIGFGAELQALRRLRPSIVSVLLALDPAVAFFFGWLVLAQSLTGWDLVGLALVLAAGVGVTYDVAVGDLGAAR